jgi:hypothetical protein
MAGLHGPCHHDPPRMPLLAGRHALGIRSEAVRQPRRFTGIGAVAVRAGRAGRATVAVVRSPSWLIGMRFADLACTWAAVSRLAAAIGTKRAAAG